MDALQKLLSRSEWQETERSAEIGDCLVWTGAHYQSGYGSVWYAGKVHYVHRLAWTERNGAVPGRLHILHHCDNPPCWRDDHLYPGTQKTNMRDMARRNRNNAGKTHCPRSHPYNEENTYTNPKGRRNCRACNRERYHEKVTSSPSLGAESLGA